MVGQSPPLIASRDWRWGVIGFDRETGICMCDASVEVALNPSKHSSANKVARGVLSPIQVADLQPAYALVA